LVAFYKELGSLEGFCTIESSFVYYFSSFSRSVLYDALNSSMLGNLLRQWRSSINYNLLRLHIWRVSWIDSGLKSFYLMWICSVYYFREFSTLRWPYFAIFVWMIILLKAISNTCLNALNYWPVFHLNSFPNGLSCFLPSYLFSEIILG